MQSFIRVSFSLILFTLVSRAFAAPQFEMRADLPVEFSNESAGATTAESVLDGALESLDFGAMQFREARGGQWQAWIEGARTLAEESFPQLPIVDRVVRAPRGQAARVHLENLQLEESQGPVAMPVEPELFVWSPLHRLSFPKARGGRYFPGKFLRASDDGGKLNVHFFPVQFDRQTGRVLTLKHADLKIDYVARPRPFLAQSTWGSDSVIVTTDAMAAAAQELADFQLSNAGVHSEVVTVETIARTEPPIDEALLPEGYKNRALADALVVPYNPATHAGYNYELARRIDEFFRKRLGEGSPLKYVTVLGDAHMVPPSYYFSTKSDSGVQFGVTDWCYGATDQCGNPRVAVGRLPLQSKEQVDNYLSKVRRWVSFADSASSELSLFGGKAFVSDVFVGELSSLGILNSTEVDWRGVHKYFRTKQSFSKPVVMDMLSGKQDAPLVYYLDHGVGNQWFVERNYVTANDILKIGDAGPKVNPVIVAISCSNAAFDDGLFSDVVFAGSQYGEVSVGVALLRSKGGAVAYLGAGRPSIGNPIYAIDRSGNLDMTGGNYQLQIMNTFFDKYRVEKDGALGDLTLQALRAFVFEQGNDMTDPRNLWTYLNMVLLGDPTLRFPVRQQLEKAYPVAKSTTKFTATGLNGFPQFLFSGTNSAFDLTFTAAAPVSESLLRVIPNGPASSDEYLEQRELPAGDAKATVKKADRQDGALRYFVRLENTQGVPLERQIWFETKTPPAAGAVTRP